MKDNMLWVRVPYYSQRLDFYRGVGSTSDGKWEFPRYESNHLRLWLHVSVGLSKAFSQPIKSFRVGIEKEERLEL